MTEQTFEEKLFMEGGHYVISPASMELERLHVALGRREAIIKGWTRGLVYGAVFGFICGAVVVWGFLG